MNRTKNAISGTIVLVIQIIIRMGVTLMIAPLLLKYGNQETLGSYSIIIQLVASLQLLELGVGRALVREIAQLFGNGDNKDLDHIKTTGVIFLCIVGLCVGFLTCVLAWSLPLWFKADFSVLVSSKWALLIFAIWMPVRFPLSYYQSYLFARQRIALYNGFLTISEVTRGILSLLVIYLGWGLPGLAIANILPELVVSGASWYWIRYRMKERTIWSIPSFRYMRRLLRVGLPLSVMSLGDKLTYQFQDVISGLVLGASSVAIMYTTRTPVFFLMTFFSRAMELVVPGLNELYGEKNMNAFRWVHHKLVSYSLGIGIWAAAGIWVFNELIVRAWLGKSLVSGHGLTLSIACFFVTALLNAILTHFLIVEGKLARYPFVVVGAGFAGLVISVVFARYLGLQGIIWANICANLITASFLIHRTRLMFSENSNSLFVDIGKRAVRCAFVGVLACALFNPATRPGNLLPWQIGFLLSLVLGSIGFAFFGLTVDDRRMLFARLRSVVLAGV